MTTATTTMKGLAEMTTAELVSLKAETYDAIRKVHRTWDVMSMADPRWPALHESRQDILRQYHRIDDELDRRGA
jgi:hypothetical protein